MNFFLKFFFATALLVLSFALLIAREEPSTLLQDPVEQEIHVVMGRTIDLTPPAELNIRLKELPDECLEEFYYLIRKISQDKSFLPELELLEDQRSQVIQLKKSFDESRRISSAEGLVEEKIRRAFEQFVAELEATLVPHQIDYLRRTSAIRAVRNQVSFSRDYLALPFLVSFDEELSNSDREQILTITRSAVADYRKTIEKELDVTTTSVLDAIPPAHRDSIALLINRPKSKNDKRSK